MEWVWGLYENFVRKQLASAGKENPTDDELQRTFMEILSDSTVTVLVQEPWQNSVRFKALAKYEWGTMTALIDDPMRYLFEQFGGGKFKLNFHQGWNFVATQNFKPQGDPKWKSLPEIEL
jgi:hypothetical protein